MISTRTIGNSERERGVWVIGALAALGVGAFAAMGSAVWVATAGILALLALIALTLPLRGVALLIAALIPFQIYFFVGESSFTLRVALVLTLIATLRVLPITNYQSLFRSWLAPAFAFLAAALIAALGADSRYLALRGIYDFAALFATAFLFSALAIPSAKWLRCLLNVLIGAGMVQAGIGIVQQIAGAERVLAALQNPLAPFFYQPNLLIEKLSDLSFNWLTFERVSPFGTFINGIDYAILLAAILCLALARMLTSRSRGELAWLAASSLLMALALALTLKGSGFLALAGGVAAIGVALAPRIPAKALALGALITTMLIALFASIDPIAGRITFLIQREQGAFGSLGRLDIWASLLDHFWQKPFFGFGLNHAVLLAEPARTMSGGTMAFVTTAPESAYVAGLVETGAVGFIALMFFLARGLGCAFQNARADARQIGIFAALVALLCGNLTVAALTTDQNGMLLGLLTGLVFAKWNPA